MFIKGMLVIGISNNSTHTNKCEGIFSRKSQTFFPRSHSNQISHKIHGLSRYLQNRKKLGLPASNLTSRVILRQGNCCVCPTFKHTGGIVVRSSASLLRYVNCRNEVSAPNLCARTQTRRIANRSGWPKTSLPWRPWVASVRSRSHTRKTLLVQLRIDTSKPARTVK